MEAVKSGTPYIATGASTLDYLQTLIPGLTYEEKGQEPSTASPTPATAW